MRSGRSWLQCEDTAVGHYEIGRGYGAELRVVVGELIVLDRGDVLGAKEQKKCL